MDADDVSAVPGLNRVGVVTLPSTLIVVAVAMILVMRRREDTRTSTEVRPD